MMSVWMRIREELWDRLWREKPINPLDVPPFIIPTPEEEERIADEEEAALGLKFNPYHSQSTGQFISAPGGVGMAGFSDAQRGAMTEFLGKHGVSHEAGVANGSVFMEHAKESGHFAEDKDWYQVSSDKCKELAKEIGVNEDRVTAMVAATSPQVPWDVTVGNVTHYRNIDNVRTLVQAVRTNASVTWTPELVNGYAERGQKVVKPLEGKTMKLSEMTPEQAGYALAPLLSCYPANTAKAIRIYQGQSPDVVLGGSKVRSFYDNLMHPQTSTAVTIDTWMVRTLTGKRENPSELGSLLQHPTSNGLKGIGSYPAFADVVVDIAGKYGVKPLEAQAIIWTQARREQG